MKKQSVGMLGLGIMGSAMAANLMKAGFRVVGYDPVAACRRRHRRAGGIVAPECEDGRRARPRSSSPRCLRPTALDSISKSDSGQNGKDHHRNQHACPFAAKEKARQRLAKAGVTLLDCPLSGTGAQAKTGDLVVFGSGDRLQRTGKPFRC